MTDKITPSRVALFRYLTVIVPALVGVIFAVIGIGLTLSQNWDPAIGTVGSCTPRIVRTANSSGTSHQICQVDWQVDGVAHSAEVDLGTGSPPAPGQSVDLRVNGNLVAVAQPAWVGPATLAAGVLLLGFAGFRFARVRRQSTSD